MDFDEIRKERNDDKEDGIFDFRISSDYSVGIIIIKGSDKRTKLSHKYCRIYKKYVYNRHLKEWSYSL